MTTLIQIDNIRKTYGTRTLFSGASAMFSEGQKIGVIGRNGEGKSTLCRMITGEETPDAGTITLTSALRLSYLRQDEPYELDETVTEFLTRFTGRPEWQCGKVAGRFDLKNEILDAEIGSLPGGFRTRVKLASMLITEPNFLILDEPTNYLDLSTLLLLEAFLADYNHGFLIVSHDREFLKQTCTETLEIELGDMTLYPGTVEDYLEYKAEQREQAMQYNARVENKKKQLEQFVTRFRAKASKAAQAKSKMKQMDRLETIEVGQSLSNVRIKIPPVDDRKGIAFECRGLDIGYPDHTVATGIFTEIDRGAHVAVLGDNGQGKSTFLRTIAGDLKPLNGTTYRWGHNTSIGYYAQHVFSALDPERTIEAELAARADESISQQEILNLAGSFLFRGEDVRKKIKVLSGGELARVCLAGLLLSKSSVLLLDEPTNHLDFETVEVLGRSLRDFNGTLFVVSHDRTFVHMLATRILDVKDGSIVSYPGNYNEYVWQLARREEDGDSGKKSNDSEKKSESSGKNAFELRKEKRSELNKKKKELNKLNETIAALKKEKAEIEKAFAKEGWSKRKSERLVALKEELEGHENDWLEVSVLVDELQRQVLHGDTEPAGVS